MKTLICRVLVFTWLAIFAVFPASAEEFSHKTPWKKRWIASVIIAAAASALDAGSSMGKPELNPVLRTPNGQFSPRRAVAFKMGGLGAAVAIQRTFARSDPGIYRTGTLVNFTSAGLFSIAAIQNMKASR